MRRTVCLSLVAGIVALGAVLTPAPALAGVLSGRDDSGDVLHHEVLPSGEPAEGTEVPGHRNIDLTDYRVRYDEHRIRVALDFRELHRREPVMLLQARFRWAGPGQYHYAEAVARATTEKPAGTARLTSGIRCDIDHEIDYAADRATLSFPARCIGSPRWVRFNAFVLTTDRIPRPTHAYVDDVHQVLDPGDDGAVERFSRRILRGSARSSSPTQELHLVRGDRRGQ